VCNFHGKSLHLLPNYAVYHSQKKKKEKKSVKIHVIRDRDK
jgi:hypothetical protein